MVKKIITAIVILLLLAACKASSDKAPVAKTSAKDIPTYKIGYMICNSEHETMQRFIPFSKYVGDKMGVKFETIPIDTINFTREIDQLDFTHTNSLLYIILNRYHGVDVLAAEQKGSLGFKSQGIILARKDSGMSQVSDLKGKTMIFGPMLAPTGFMAQVDVMLQNGIDPEQDLAMYTIPGGSFKHEKVIYGVMFGKFDAGSIPIDDLETMDADNRVDMEDFVILGKNEPIPYCNFGVPQKTDEALARKFKEVVLDITPEDTVEMNGEVIKVLDRALVQGYVDIKDGDFDIVREMAKRTNMPPYQKY
ncbi:MAG: phosphate/phosphite/phosphonate ABC transporter substrate-binding protein [Proteobacteria bacterium]|nr:phosphate/phosphite/phosphonate ABC transporter substrate-binding protein [Pseudomonadota bacterium]MBU1688647.1 phosphate/phosphite/phosphonate ABC transporter substrate-binding protein [Pseudomonadota bacterium]